jgi:hypothetical protein
MKPDYYIGGGDYMGDNCPNENFNKVTVPRLLELGIKPENMDEVAKMFADIYEIVYMEIYRKENFNNFYFFYF